MPNIEIHGMEERVAIRTRSHVWSRIKDTSFVDNAVVEILLTTVQDVAGLGRPYLRLNTTDGTEARELVAALQPMGFDMEHVHIDEFIEGSRLPVLPIC